MTKQDVRAALEDYFSEGDTTKDGLEELIELLQGMIESLEE